jgi:cell filamentation protein
MGKKKKPIQRRDRYDTSGNVEAEYVDTEQAVLRNKQSITDLSVLQTAEEVALAHAYRALLREVRTDTPLTCELLRHIHAAIFGGLYEWAGRWRTVWISKPGTTWPTPDFLDRNMEEFERTVLRKYPASSIQDDDAFCAAAAEIKGEFLVIHPLREGNARTIKLATDLLAAQTGRPLLAYDQTEQAVEEYIKAAKAAFHRSYRPMAAIIRQALAEARRGK